MITTHDAFWYWHAIGGVLSLGYNTTGIMKGIRDNEDGFFTAILMLFIVYMFSWGGIISYYIEKRGE